MKSQLMIATHREHVATLPCEILHIFVINNGQRHGAVSCKWKQFYKIVKRLWHCLTFRWYSIPIYLPSTSVGCSRTCGPLYVKMCWEKQVLIIGTCS